MTLQSPKKKTQTYLVNYDFNFGNPVFFSPHIVVALTITYHSSTFFLDSTNKDNVQYNTCIIPIALQMCVIVLPPLLLLNAT